MNIEKNIYGYLVISDIINNQYIEHKYMDYTRKEAVSHFKETYLNNVGRLGE